MKGWSGNAVKFGVASAVVTLLLNWIGNATASGDACHRSSPLGLLAFLVFLGLMGAAGFVTARGGGTIGASTMAGLVGALISAVGRSSPSPSLSGRSTPAAWATTPLASAHRRCSPRAG